MLGDGGPWSEQGPAKTSKVRLRYVIYTRRGWGIDECQAWFTLGWKSTEWTQSRADLWNNLGFSLCAVPSVCCMVTTSDDRKKSEVKVSADWCVTVEHQRSSSIRVIFINYQTSKLQCNY